jgi:SAM-dependent methyltransferase
VTLPNLYTELADWYPLLSIPTDYEEEASIFVAALDELAPRPIRTMLELGCGGGANASFMKHRYDMTLTDLSPRMLDQSKKINPELEHIEGDMRTLRLRRTFDAVFVHDAIAYMTTEDDLAAAIETASVHCASPGIALFVPDETVENYRRHAYSNEHTDGDRTLRYIAHTDDIVGTMIRTRFTITMREGEDERVVHDDHITGVFPRATWVSLIERAGYEFVARPYRHSTFAPNGGQELFFGLKR